MTQKIDILNIVLVVISFFLALVLPVRLFLFSYAVLGPLHYLTEIGWLEKRNYFSRKKSDVWILGILCGILTIGYFLAQLDFIDPSGNTASISWMEPILEINQYAGAGIVFFAFVSALAMVFIRTVRIRYGIIVLGGIAALFIHHIQPVYLLFGLFVPTIIHVSIFTGLFMLYGALKAKSVWGYIAVALFTLGCLAIFQIEISPKLVGAKTDDLQRLLDSTFIHIGASLSEFLGMRAKGDDYLLMTTLGLQIQMLFSFCYTYHYLNWFSKTKIINWHEVSKRWLWLTGIIWIASISLYSINYKLGFLALFFLSMLHVFLEFPLNGLSIAGIYQEIRGRIVRPT